MGQSRLTNSRKMFNFAGRGVEVLAVWEYLHSTCWPLFRLKKRQNQGFVLQNEICRCQVNGGGNLEKITQLPEGFSELQDASLFIARSRATANNCVFLVGRYGRYESSMQVTGQLRQPCMVHVRNMSISVPEILSLNPGPRGSWLARSKSEKRKKVSRLILATDYELLFS